jgi:hypothetical protein
MTISYPFSIVAYAGDGVSVSYPIDFYWIDDAHISVQLVLADLSVTSWANGTDYTLLGEGDMIGGTLTAMVAPPAGTTLYIRRVVPAVQLDDYVAHNTFPAETMEKDLDYLTMICQQMQESINSLVYAPLINFANIGGVGANVYAGTTGAVAQLKRITGAGSTVVTESASLITVTSSAAGIDLALDYPWTGHHSWDKQAKRAIPSHTMKSLEGGVDITDGGILLASDYVTMLDMRMRTDCSVDGPVDASEGGNFAIYGQHLLFGNCNANGMAAGGIRMQVQTTAVRTFGSPGIVAGYFSVYNNGTDQGAFGIHADAYHSGTFAGFSHSTYGLSCEVFKNTAGGIALGSVMRSMGSQPLDFGMSVLHATGAAGFKRGIQLGSPLIANGGLPGGTGTLTAFDVGIDLTWGSYTYAALQIKANDYIYLGGQALAQSATPIDACTMRWNNVNGNFQVGIFGSPRFEVNMTNGMMRQNNNDAIALFDSAHPWVFSLSSTGKVSASASTISTGGNVPAKANYMVWIIDGVSVRVPYFLP